MKEQVLAEQEKVLGMRHSATIHARVNLAISYWSAGRREDAIELMERAVRESEEVLGAGHPHSIERRGWLEEWRE